MAGKLRGGVWTVILLCGVVQCAAGGDNVRQVRVEGFHACCGRCVEALTKALSRVEGVTELTASRQTRVCTFRVRDEDTVGKALDAMWHAGFGGRASVDGRPISVRHEPVPADQTAARIQFAGVHLCCKGCAVAVAKAYEEAEAVEAVDCDVKAGTVTLSGTKMRVAAMRDVLYGAGFGGRIAR